MRGDGARCFVPGETGKKCSPVMNEPDSTVAGVGAVCRAGRFSEGIGFPQVQKAGWAVVVVGDRHGWLAPIVISWLTLSPVVDLGILRGPGTG